MGDYGLGGAAAAGKFNAIVPKPVQEENGDYVVRPHIGFSLTIDHRVVDGAPGARFLKALCDSIAAVDTMLPVWG